MTADAAASRVGSFDPSRPLAEAVVAAYLDENRCCASRRVGEGQWIVVLSGDVRHAIPVAVEIGTGSCSLTSFLLRGPAGPATADLHRVLLRKNRDLLRVRYCLDGDDDVLLVARLALRDLDAETLDATLGEIQTVGEQSFEALVHLGYPGVFPALQRTVGGSTASAPVAGRAAAG